LLQVNNEVLCAQNKELQHEINVIKKRPIQQTTLTTQDGDNWHGSAVFYSPRKLASKRTRKAAELDEAAQLQLKNTCDREAKAAATAYKKQQQEEARVARQRTSEERCQAKKAQAEVLAVTGYQMSAQKAATQSCNCSKSHDTLKKRKQKASHSAAKDPTKRHCVVAAQCCVDAVPPAASPPLKCTKNSCNIRKPARFE
jgi:hypothetical protein